MIIRATINSTVYFCEANVSINVAAYIGREKEAQEKYGALHWEAIQSAWYLTMVRRGLIRFGMRKETPYILLYNSAINYSLYESEGGEETFGKTGMSYLRKTWVLGLAHAGKIVFAMNKSVPDVFVNGKCVDYTLQHDITKYGIFKFGDSWSIISNTWIEGISSMKNAISTIITIEIEVDMVFRTINGYELKFPMFAGKNINQYYDYLLDSLYILSLESRLYFAHRCHKVATFGADTTERYTPNAIELLDNVMPMISKAALVFKKKLHAIFADIMIPDISEIVSSYMI